MYARLLQKLSEGEDLNPTEIKALHRLEGELKEKVGQGDIDDGSLINSFDEAAAYLGISKRMVSHWMKKGKIRQNSDGTFDREELDRFRRERSGKGREEEDEIRLKKFRARHQELLVGQLEGQLVAKEEVERQFSERAYEFKSDLYMVVRRAGPKLAAKSKKTLKEVEKILKREFDLMLKKYSRPMRIKRELIKR